MAILWFGHILKRVDRSFVLVWSGRAQQFMGYFLFLWLMCLMSPRNVSRLYDYVRSDWQQIQHISLAFIFLAAGTSETTAGHVIIRDRKRRRKMKYEDKKDSKRLLCVLHVTWTFHLFTAGILFLFHPQAHEAHLAMHRVLGLAVCIGALSTGFSKCLETIRNDTETLKYYSAMLLPKVCWIAVIQILLFFPHHGAVIHIGFYASCQPSLLRIFVILSGVIAFASIVSTNLVWYICLSRRRNSNRSSSDYRKLLQLGTLSARNSDNESFCNTTSDSDDDVDAFPFLDDKIRGGGDDATYIHDGEIWRRPSADL